MSGELQTIPPKNDLKYFLEKHINAIEAVASATLTPERMVRLVCAAASRDEKLASCTPMSILRSLAQAASMGLEPFDGRNEVHLVPRWNKKIKPRGAMEATCLIGYPGLIRLATETGKVRNVEARVVYQSDEFVVDFGDTPRIVHKPTWQKDRGPIIAFYAVAFLPDGSKTFDVMPMHEVEAIRDRSKEPEAFSPWKTDFVEMGRKTAVRRLAKYLPKSAAFVKALELQAKTEAGEYLDAESEPIHPGDIPSLDGPSSSMDDDGNEVFEWTEDDVANFHTACDVLDKAVLNAGGSAEESDEKVNLYKAQKAAQEDPSRVINRMHTMIQSLAAKAKQAAK
jgi:recombination protein RecT